MDHFNYKNGELYAEEVKLADIAAEIGTPFYCYSTATLTRHYNVFAEGLAGLDTLIAFAVKSNSCLAVISELAKLGAGADVVSEGEIRRALAAHVPPGKIIFSGVGKTREEMAFALSAGIFQFNVESEPELLALDETARSLGKKAAIAIRVNPDVEAATNAKIATGHKKSKFGVDIDVCRELFARAASLSNIELQGISVHIGSQITDLAPFAAAFAKVRELYSSLAASGINIKVLDLGGGIGIPYQESKTSPSPAEYTKLAKQVFSGLPCKLVFEPGRVIAGNAGILVSRVIYVKPTGERNFLIIDAAMNDLIRPSFYNAYHEIIPVLENKGERGTVLFDIVGPVCESGDTFAELRELPELHPGELIAIRSAGAYGSVMASGYNSRLIAPEVMVRGKESAVVSRRQSYEEMLSRETLRP